FFCSSTTPLTPTRTTSSSTSRYPSTTPQFNCIFGVLAHFPFLMANIHLKFTSCTTTTNLWTPLNPHTLITVYITLISYVLIPNNGFSLLYMHFPCRSNFVTSLP
ncbi:hypothetical protein EV424DRAFT_1401691, partial [Suillus variegatus]